MPKYLTMLEGDEPEMLDASQRQQRFQKLPPVARRQQPAAKNGIRSARIVCGRSCPGGISVLLSGDDVDELGYSFSTFLRQTKNVAGDVAHVGLNVARAVVPIAATGLGTAVGAALGTNAGGGAGAGGMLPQGLLDMFGFGGGSGAAPQAAGQPQQQQTGIDPRLLYIGGGALLLVLLVRK